MHPGMNEIPQRKADLGGEEDQAAGHRQEPPTAAGLVLRAAGGKVGKSGAGGVPPPPSHSRPAIPVGLEEGPVQHDCSGSFSQVSLKAS